MPAQHVQTTSLDRDKACALTASTAEPPEDDEGGVRQLYPFIHSPGTQAVVNLARMRTILM